MPRRSPRRSPPRSPTTRCSAGSCPTTQPVQRPPERSSTWSSTSWPARRHVNRHGRRHGRGAVGARRAGTDVRRPRRPVRRRAGELCAPHDGRILELVGLMDQLHPHEPHEYLWFVGVVPAAQGRGLCSALIVPVLHRADRAGHPAYLEATSPQNKALYERHGFRVAAPFAVAGGPPMWPMWRDPAGHDRVRSRLTAIPLLREPWPGRGRRCRRSTRPRKAAAAG